MENLTPFEGYVLPIFWQQFRSKTVKDMWKWLNIIVIDAMDTWNGLNRYYSM